MNKPHNKEHWYKELDSHIKCFYAYNKQRKTILINQEKPHFYNVVTRVNYLSTMLWIEHVNALIKTLAKDKFEPKRFGWLAEQKNYRREFLNKVNNSINQ